MPTYNIKVTLKILYYFAHHYIYICTISQVYFIFIWTSVFHPLKWISMRGDGCSRSPNSGSCCRTKTESSDRFHFTNNSTTRFGQAHKEGKKNCTKRKQRRGRGVAMSVQSNTVSDCMTDKRLHRRGDATVHNQTGRGGGLLCYTDQSSEVNIFLIADKKNHSKSTENLKQLN